MKKLLIVIGCLAAGAVGARQQNLAQLAPSQFADTEVSTNMPCVLDIPSLKEYRIGLGLVVTPSNNVEVALGHDADGDGRFKRVRDKQHSRRRYSPITHHALAVPRPALGPRRLKIRFPTTYRDMSSLHKGSYNPPPRRCGHHPHLRPRHISPAARGRQESWRVALLVG